MNCAGKLGQMLKDIAKLDFEIISAYRIDMKDTTIRL
jgi:hypothetical protein